MEERQQEKWDAISPYLNERSRRIYAATEAKAIGRGGIKMMGKVTGMAYQTIKNGMNELDTSFPKQIDVARIRKPGGGRKKHIDKDPTLLNDLKVLVEDSRRGDPESPLLWSSKSTYKLADELNKNGHRISHDLVGQYLEKMGYSLQGNKKVKEGNDHPDRDAQFHFINQKVKLFQKNNQPVISTDTKKKENIGEYKNIGRQYCLKGSPREVNTYDFPDAIQGKAAPYGVFDVNLNKGWVSVGTSSDTAQFAVNSIESWWNELGKIAYPNAKELYINCDGGGSNSTRSRLWKRELQRFANRYNLVIHVSHFPPGTSKWNKIEHKMFSFITMNWRGRPLVDLVTIISLISNTKNKAGLEIIAKQDSNTYQKGIIVTDEEFNALHIEKEVFHGEWNYKILPKT